MSINDTLYNNLSSLLARYGEACSQANQPIERSKSHQLHEELDAWLENLTDMMRVLIRDNHAAEATNKRYKMALEQIRDELGVVATILTDDPVALCNAARWKAQQALEGSQ